MDILRITQVITKVETFFRDIKKTKDLVLAILTRHFHGKYLCVFKLTIQPCACVYVNNLFSGPLNKKAKRMLRTLEDIPPKFSVYDLFDLDAIFMLQLLNIATTTLVTLLQIAFL